MGGDAFYICAKSVTGFVDHKGCIRIRVTDWTSVVQIIGVNKNIKLTRGRDHVEMDVMISLDLATRV